MRVVAGEHVVAGAGADGGVIEPDLGGGADVEAGRDRGVSGVASG